MSETYYKILGVDENATFEQMKTKYQQLVKLYHPDKQTNPSPETFIKIDEAWKILRDEKLRKEYDSSLLQCNLKEMPLIYANLNINELEFENNICDYPCRCGATFIINRNEIEDDCIYECAECSNCISIKYK